MNNSANNSIYTYLKNLQLAYKKVDHPAVFTTTEADQYTIGKGVAKCKNLFLRNRKKTKYYLVVMESDKRFNLKEFSLQMDEKKLSFASENDLMKYLKVTSGSVSPFTLINNTDNNVIAIIDEDLIKYEKVGFHPNINTSTLILTSNDFKKYLKSLNNTVIFTKLY
jgi:Ala-tRNA(Pro) deacylase